MDAKKNSSMGSCRTQGTDTALGECHSAERHSTARAWLPQKPCPVEPVSLPASEEREETLL
jgi:hypothetical protein